MNSLIFTFFDALALFYLFKTTLGFVNNKRICAILSLILNVILCGVYYYFGVNSLGITFYQTALLVFGIVLIESLMYSVFTKGNLKPINIILAILILASVIKLYLDVKQWYILLFILPLEMDLLALDCSDMKGYTILNAAASIFYILATVFLGKAFPVVASVLYFIGSIIAYVKVNKLSVLKDKKESKKKKKEKDLNNKEK